MEQDSPIYKNYTPGGSVTKVQSAVDHHPPHNDSISIDLSNQKVESQLEFQHDNHHLFSKTATNEFLAVSNHQPGPNESTPLVSHLLDSQASSPTMKSDFALKSTAQFQQQQQQMPLFGGTEYQRKAPHQPGTNINQKQQVLAASNPGHSSHLKSQSTSNTNYFSQMQAAQMEQSQNSQGRTTEQRKKPSEQTHGLTNAGAKSAVLHTNTSKNREIKRIPSKTKVGEKNQIRKRATKDMNHMIAQENAFEMPNEVVGYHHQTSKSQGKQMHPSQTGRGTTQGSDTAHNSIMQQNSHQNTPQINHPMFAQGVPMPQGDQYAGFSFVQPIGQAPFQFQQHAAMSAQHQAMMAAGGNHMGYPMQPQPQVHFIAKQQKFYGISPERAPLIFKQASHEKRPYTSSGQALNKKAHKQSAQSQAMAALYLGSKTHQNGFGQGGSQQRNMSQPTTEEGNNFGVQAAHAAYSMQAIPSKKKNNVNGYTSNSAHVNRKDKGHVGGNGTNFPPGGYMIGNQKLPEQLQDEVIKLKQMTNTHKEENIKLKTRIKILENEMGRKERTIEDFLQQNQFIHNAQKNAVNMGGALAPIVQTAQRYQAETFLVMSLKKQVKEQKTELIRKDEELVGVKKNIKNTKFYEMDQEMKLYKDELIRLRYLLESAHMGTETTVLNTLPNTMPDTQPTSGRPSVQTYAHSPINMPQSQNSSQPLIMLPSQPSSAIGNFKVGTCSQTNFFPDTISNLSQNPIAPAGGTNAVQSANYPTLTNDHISSSTTQENQQTQLPPLLRGNAQANGNLTTPVQQQMQATGISNALSADGYTPGITNNNIMTSLSQVDTKDTEFVQILTSQLADKDAHIRKLQSQVEEYSRQRLARLSNSEGKGGSAGPNQKSEMSRLKKLVRDKNNEIQKLRTENVQVLAKSAADDEHEKKVKQLQSQVSSYLKKTNELKSEMKRKDEKNDNLTKDLAFATDQQKTTSEKQKRDQSSAHKKLQAQVDQMTRQIEETNKENKRLAEQLQQTNLKLTEEKESNTVAPKTLVEPKQSTEKIQVEKKDVDQKSGVVDQKALEKEEASAPSKIEAKKEAKTEAKVEAKTEAKAEEEKEKLPQFDSKTQGELGLVATVLGCRENRDRIELAQDFKDFLAKQEASADAKKKEEAKKGPLGLASDYKLSFSDELKDFMKTISVQLLARTMPKYDFISPSLAMIIMTEVRKMLHDPEIMDILSEKESETKLPFDALRDLCTRFDRHFSDEHCAFITASYLTEIDEGVIYINFKELMTDLKDPRSKEMDFTQSKHRATSSLGSEGSDSEMRRVMRAGASPLSEVLSRSAGKSGLGRAKKSIDEEHMLDVSEAIFMKMADLMIEKSRSVRGIFTKYAVPEIFPDRTILELLSPGGFLEGIKETGIEELQEFEIICLMRVLAKPELENSVILNEFVMIMENFGVQDVNEEDENEEYIPDTEASVNQSVDGPPTQEEDEDNKKEDGEAAAAKKDGPEEAKKEKDQDGKKEKDQDGKKQKDQDGKAAKPKRKPRQHDLKNVDEKGVKILRKLARYLLKQFLHPREFFGKSVTKELIKTKKREFNLEVMKFKDFYLKIKIANIRKRLTENESLNKEICIDSKTHKDQINVKLMVKALEELAEEEQKKLVEEERTAFEKHQKEMEETKQKVTIPDSDVETPRSGSEDVVKSSDKAAVAGEESKTNDSKDKGDKIEESKESKDAKSDKDKEGGTLDMMKFGNAMRTKNITHSPMLSDRQFLQLNTIEEEKHETQTSNYVEGASEREDSKLFSSHNLRSSNITGLEFEEEQMKQMKDSPDGLGKGLSLGDKNSNSVVMSSASDIENVKIEVNQKGSSTGNLTGREKSSEEAQLSKSMAEATMNRFIDKEGGAYSDASYSTPITVTGESHRGDKADKSDSAAAAVQEPPKLE